MRTTVKKSLLFGFFVCATALAYGQVVGYKLLVDSVHYGPVGAVDLDGYITYTLAVEFEDPTDFLTSCYGLNPVGDPLCVADTSDVILNFDCDVYNTPDFGGFEASAINCDFIPVFPELEFDSFVTIGISCAEPSTVLTFISVCPTAADIEADFDAGNGIFIDDGLWFTLPGSINGYAGDDRLVEVAQFTTCGGVEGCFDIQWYFDDDVTTSTQSTICLDEPNPCLANALNTEITFLTEAPCADDLPLIQVGDSPFANGPITFDIYADGIFQETASGNHIFETLLPDVEYQMAMADSIGCRDTTEVFSFTVPEQLIFEAELTQGVSCFGETNAEASIVYGGGLPPYTLTANGEEIVLDDTVTGFSCGLINLVFTDVSGCADSVLLDIACPPELVLLTDTIPVSCAGLCDAEITALAEGGTGILNLSIYPDGSPDAPLAETSSPASASAAATEVCPGDYVVAVFDAQGCSSYDSLSISLPPALSLSIDEVTNILCGGDCDGTVSITAAGGTGSLDLTLNGNPTSEAALFALCASDPLDELCIEDENGCSICEAIVITENPPLEVLVSIEDATCEGQADGSLTFFPQGGTGTLDASIDPEVPNPNEVENGSYYISIEDALGCTLDTTVVVGVELETDLEVDFLETPVSCFDQTDGGIEAVVEGGIEPILIEWGDINATTGTTLANVAAGSYLVTISDSLGCTIDSIAYVSPNPDCIFIATAITPNGDGYNDLWFLGGMEFHPTAVVQVYNRWGQILFEEQGYQQAWDGRYRGEDLPLGDYYYYIDLQNGNPPYTGTVTIKY